MNIVISGPEAVFFIGRPTGGKCEPICADFRQFKSNLVNRGQAAGIGLGGPTGFKVGERQTSVCEEMIVSRLLPIAISFLFISPASRN